MPQFDVYKNPNPQTKARFPLLLEVQSDLLSGLKSCVIIPLADATRGAEGSIEKLMPTVEVNQSDYVMVTPQLAGISRRQLGKQVANIAASRNRVLAALDFLIVGY